MKPLQVAALLLFPLTLAASVSGHEGIPAPANPTHAVSNGEVKLLIRLDVGTEGGDVGRHVADYRSDGMVTRWTIAGSECRPALPCGTMQSNILTATGLATLRAFLTTDADLLDRPRDFRPRVVPGESSSSRADIINNFVLERPDGSRYVVSAPSPSSPNSPAWAPDPVIERLAALADALVDPASLVGPDGLANSIWEPYLPARMAAFVLRVEIAPKPDQGQLSGPDVPDISDIGWPFQGTPDTFGAAFTPDTFEGTSNGGTYSCSFLPSADGMAVLDSLTGPSLGTLAASQLAWGDAWRGRTMRWTAKSPTTGIALILLPLLPSDAAASCAAALSY